MAGVTGFLEKRLEFQIGVVQFRLFDQHLQHQIDVEVVVTRGLLVRRK